MKDIIQAVANRLTTANLAHPIIWENFSAPNALPRYEARLGPNVNATRAYSGLSAATFLVQIDCVVAAGDGLRDQVDMIEALVAQFPAGTHLECGVVQKRPAIGPATGSATANGNARNGGEHRRSVTIEIRDYL